MNSLTFKSFRLLLLLLFIFVVDDAAAAAAICGSFGQTSATHETAHKVHSWEFRSESHNKFASFSGSECVRVYTCLSAYLCISWFVCVS